MNLVGLTLLPKMLQDLNAGDVSTIASMAAKRFAIDESVVRQAIEVVKSDRPGDTVSKLLEDGTIQRFVQQAVESRSVRPTILVICDACQAPFETTEWFKSSISNKILVPCPLCNHLTSTDIQSG